jgi:hypothetical protein
MFPIVFLAFMLDAIAAAVLIALIAGVTLWRSRALQATMATTRTGGSADAVDESRARS